jgi:hypothetical protein
MTDEMKEIEYLRRHAQRLLAIAEVHKSPASPQLREMVRDIQQRIDELEARAK